MKYFLFAALMFQSIAYAEDSIRVGWQIPWATQGQIVQILKHTDILKKNGLKAEFIGKTFGPELNELAMAQAVDVILTADQPAITLFSKNKDWQAIGRLMYNRTTTYVPTNSEIQNISQLKGKKVGVPVGAAAERILKSALIENAINPQKDITLINLGMLEHGPLIQKYAKEKQWGDFDALSGFDPAPAIFESKKWVRILHTGQVVSLVLMSNTLQNKNPGVAKKLMQSIFDAYDYYRLNQTQANTWFLEEAKLNGGDQTTCEIAAQLEPNLKVKQRAELRLSLSAQDIEVLKQVSLFLEPSLKQRVDVEKFINASASKGLK